MPWGHLQPGLISNWRLNPCPTKSFLPDLLESCFRRCAHLGQMRQYAMTALRKLHLSLRLRKRSYSRMADMLFFQGLRSVGVIQYPGQSVSWTAHSHWNGFTVNPFASNQEWTLSYESKSSSQVLAKRPMLSKYTSSLSRTHRISSMICFFKSRAHLRSMSKCLYLYFQKGVMYNSWDSLFSSNV